MLITQSCVRRRLLNVVQLPTALEHHDAGNPIDIDQYTAGLITLGMANATVRNYRALLVRWCDWCDIHGHRWELLDPIPLRQWSDGLASRSMRAQAAGMLKHLAAMLEWSEPLDSAIKIGRARPSTCKALTDEQSRRLYAHASTRGLRGLAVMIGLQTAARRGEIASLRWSDIDWESGTITITQTKTDSLVQMPMHPALREALEARHVARDRSCAFIFPGRNLGHAAYGTVGAWIKIVAAEVGIDLHSHVLRHTALQRVLEHTDNLRTAQTLANHSKPETTARYTKATERQIARAVAALDYAA